MEKPTRPLCLFAIILNLSLVACASDPADELGSTSQALDVSGLGLKMPLPAGYRWKVNTNPGFYSPPPNEVKYHSGDWWHAIDFGDNVDIDGIHYDRGADDIDVLAAADGIVSYVQRSGCANGDGNGACRVFINHSGTSKHYSSYSDAGYETEYTHLTSGNAILVSVGQFVKQGQPIGKMGTTGTDFSHLHFGVYYNGKADQNNSALSGLMLEETPFADYALDQRYPSNNHNNDPAWSIPGVAPWKGSFDFTLDSNSVYGCTDTVTGGESTNWIYSCQNRQTVYEPGQNVNVVIRTDNVRKNVAFSVEAWRNGQPSPDWTWTDPELQVEPNVWTHAFYLPRFDNVYAGDWEMRIFADVGSGFFKLTTFHFTVLGNQQWPGSPYQYNGNSYTCNGSVTGGASTNWIYTCNGQQSSYAASDNVTVLMRIDNVTSSHRFRARIFQNGSHLYTTNPTGWNDVPSGQTWQYAHYWTTIGNVSSGSYEARVDIDLPGGDEFENVNVAIIPFTVNPVAPFSYNGNAVTCSNEPTGGSSTNWIYTCPRPTSVFSQGQNVRVLAFVQDVRQSYRFRSRFYRNGSSTAYSEQLTDWTTVPSGQVWSTAYTWPTLWWAVSGNWRASVEIDVGSGWQMLRSDITFTVNAPIGGYSSSSFNVCLGNYQNERDASGVPQCWTPVSSQNSLSSLSTYYWRLRFTGLAVNTNVQFRIEAYHSGTLGWSWDFGPYLPASNGEAWFFPEFANPGPGNWELLFFLKIGSGSFQQVDAHSFFAY